MDPDREHYKILHKNYMKFHENYIKIKLRTLKYIQKIQNISKSSKKTVKMEKPGQQISLYNKPRTKK